MADTQGSAHTLGRWHVNGVDTIMSVEGNCTIAKVFHPERDAQLLAAAPELLDALEAAMPVLARFEGTVGKSSVMEIRDKARAAIEKAG
ncbi:hypothetical protein LCGC14_2371640 [marine sediment metagenome]|uniref:Uncharacterized protein n=1 Tax=marine sediment metagenome TaxID=412755 RepID=A0A0F9CQV6_9ZZZZ